MNDFKQLKDKNYYETLKNKIGSKYGIIWKEIAGRYFVGNCSFLYKKLKPIDYQDFFTKYINYVQPNETKSLKKSQYYGRSINDLLKLSIEYKKRANDYEFTVEDFFDDIVNHVIIETFDGHAIEDYILRILEGKGYTVNNEDGNMDARLGVDLTVRWKNKLLSYLQIKPITTFIGNNNLSLKRDRANFFEKQKELDAFVIEQQNKGNTLYCIKPIEYMLYDKSLYDKESKILFYYKNDKVRFILDELCDKDGNSLINLHDFELKKLIIK